MYTKRLDTDSCFNTRCTTLGHQRWGSEKIFAVFADALEFRHLVSQESLSSMPESCPQLTSDENRKCPLTYQFLKYTAIELPLLRSTVPQLLIIFL